jgi:hypothetical protein
MSQPRTAATVRGGRTLCSPDVPPGTRSLTRASEIADYLSSHKNRLSHGRPITLRVVKDELKINKIVDLKDDPELRELIGELWARSNGSLMQAAPTIPKIKRLPGEDCRRDSTSA